MQSLFRSAAIAAAMFVAPITSVAETLDAQFNVTISGFPVGRVSYEGTLEDNRYKVQGFMGSTGFFGLFISTRYSGAAIGNLIGNRPSPEVFRGRFEQRRLFAQVDIRYNDGLPISIDRTPARAALETDATPRQARDHMDPISALYFLLRDKSDNELCRQDFGVFEGTRTAQVKLSRATVDSDGNPLVDRVICNGMYRRVAGFLPEELAERTDFPFTITYRPTADGRHAASEFLALTEFGLAKAVRSN